MERATQRWIVILVGLAILWTVLYLGQASFHWWKLLP